MAVTEPRDALAGDLLRLARAKAGLTQAELAARAGVAQSLISAYENGHRQPTLPSLKRVLACAGLELRTRLEPPDDQSATAAQWEATRPQHERQRWTHEQLDDVIRSKEAAGRDKDIAALPILIEHRRVLDRARDAAPPA